MIITFYGGNTVRFQTGDTLIASNPSLALHGNKQQKVTANTTLCSSFKPEHHATENISFSSEELFIMDGPGSYEQSGITFIGEPIAKSGSVDSTENTTAYRFVMDDMSVCVLGSVVSRDQLNPDASEIFAEPDILIIPVTGETVDQAQAFITFVGPKAVIPVGYWSKDDAAIVRFCKEIGFKGEFSEKITLKRRDVEQMSKQIIPLAI